MYSNTVRLTIYGMNLTQIKGLSRSEKNVEAINFGAGYRSDPLSSHQSIWLKS